MHTLQAVLLLPLTTDNEMFQLIANTCGMGHEHPSAEAFNK